jgi:hypothetical protein
MGEMNINNIVVRTVQPFYIQAALIGRENITWTLHLLLSLRIHGMSFMDVVDISSELT